MYVQHVYTYEKKNQKRKSILEVYEEEIKRRSFFFAEKHISDNKLRTIFLIILRANIYIHFAKKRT